MRGAFEHTTQEQRHDSPQSSYDPSYDSSVHDPSVSPPTSYTGSLKTRPIVHNEPRHRDGYVTQQYISDGPRCATPTSIEEERRSQSTVSFIDSEEEAEDEDEDLAAYDLPPKYTEPRYQPSVISSTPAEFSDLFPSHRRLDIRHDDSEDGNMNLRVDTELRIHGRKCDMTLYHLRMHDLRNREFSLRRYCRESGREVCQSSRIPKGLPQIEKRPGLQRSLSNAIHSLRPKLEPRSSSGPTPTELRRYDSGYGSMHSSDEEYRPTSSGSNGASHAQRLMNSVRLEFSNYAQMYVSLAKDKKRYEFDYWKYNLAWKRVVDKSTNETSFHLIDRKQNNSKVFAFIRPIPLTDSEAEEERFSGGWIPKCMMWIADDGIVDASKDVADAVVASGLIALVDDAIRSHFHSEESKLLLVPKSKHQMGALINEMFSRNDSKLEKETGHAFMERQSRTSRMTSGSGRPSSRGH